MRVDRAGGVCDGGGERIDWGVGVCEPRSGTGDGVLRGNADGDGVGEACSLAEGVLPATAGDTSAAARLIVADTGGVGAPELPSVIGAGGAGLSRAGRRPPAAALARRRTAIAKSRLTDVIIPSTVGGKEDRHLRSALGLVGPNPVYSHSIVAGGLLVIS